MPERGDIIREVMPSETDEQIDLSRLPRHIAIIMDGNGRWARQRGLPRIAGHREGINSVRAVVEECRRLGVGHLTLYAFSYENWKRPEEEVNALMTLLAEYLKREKQELIENQIRLSAFGETSLLPQQAQEALQDVIDATEDLDAMRLNLALNYSGRRELVRAAKRIAVMYASGKLDLANLDEALFSSFLYSFDQPDPDLLIRTSGELRVSNFLLWQIAYTEIWVTQIFWPDFRKEHLREAILAYQARSRRFGSVDE